MWVSGSVNVSKSLPVGSDPWNCSVPRVLRMGFSHLQGLALMWSYPQTSCDRLDAFSRGVPICLMYLIHNSLSMLCYVYILWLLCIYIYIYTYRYLYTYISLYPISFTWSHFWHHLMKKRPCVSCGIAAIRHRVELRRCRPDVPDEKLVVSPQICHICQTQHMEGWWNSLCFLVQSEHLGNWTCTFRGKKEKDLKCQLFLSSQKWWMFSCFDCWRVSCCEFLWVFLSTNSFGALLRSHNSCPTTTPKCEKPPQSQRQFGVLDHFFDIFWIDAMWYMCSIRKLNSMQPWWWSEF